MSGIVRVGQCKYINGKRIDPSYENFTNIVCLTKSTPYGDIGPYCLKNNQGQIMENIWQFSKIYESVPKSIQKYSRYQNFVIWDWPAEVHYKDNKPTKEYTRWRNTGMNNKYPVRYPVGYSHRHKCLGVLHENKLIDYIDSRKLVYGPLYCDLVKKTTTFKNLQKRLLKGENLLICEVDVAFQEGMEYYKTNYNVDDSFIENNTMIVNEQNFNIVLNDSKYRMGHGYFLAAALLNKDTEWLK